MDPVVRQLARALAPQPSPGDGTYLERALVVTAHTATNTYDVTYNGASIAGVPAYRDVFAVAGDTVEMMMVDNTPVIIGVCGSTPWVGVTFQNSWASLASPEQPMQYRRDGAGAVWLRGNISGPSLNTIAFTLPAGFRPPNKLAFSCANGPGTAVGVFIVFPDGTVNPFTGSTSAMNLNCSFLTY